jgi:glutamate/aspartate transport system substrate-binding protein
MTKLTCFSAARLLLAAGLSTGFAHGLGAQGLGPSLQKVKETGTITIGYRESSIPFSYLDDSQRPVGFSGDLCSLVVAKVKAKLGLPNLKVAYQAVNASNRIPLVKKGKTVAVTQGTNTAQFVAKLNTEKKLGLKTLQGKDHAESFLLVQTGRAAAFMEDDILLAGLKANAAAPGDFAFLTDAFPSDPYGLVVSKDDPGFKQLVDEALMEAMKSGQYDRLYAKWFESPIPPKNINLNFAQSEKLKGLIKSPSDKAIGQ